ncbi:MAG: methyltransferase domain-containing protein [Planctomycetales bacterium]|nr:methyltransferase domain-containing protein [Planctomycetales bacterium]
MKTRDRQDEWMDQPDLDAGMHADALRGLCRVNRFSGAVGSIWKPIADLARETNGVPLRVLDVASGGGDVAISLKKLATRRGVPIEVVGCDISETAIAFATDQARDQQVDVSFIRHNVLSDPMPDGFDVVCCSLFLHHLDGDDVVRVLHAMRSAAKRRVVISDLMRTNLGYVLAKWGIRLLTSSPVCHVDGPLSVKAALTISEARCLAERAGWTRMDIRRNWPERFLMVCDTD